MPHATILIAGAGIGGVTAGIALAQRGFRVEIFERAPEIKPIGAGLMLQPNATLMLDRMGILDRVIREGEARILDVGGILDWRGRLLGELALRSTAETVGAPCLAMHRGRLQAALVSAATDAGVTIATHRTATGFDPSSPTGVKLLFRDGSDGGEHAVGDALIGADGLHSAIRAQLLGDEPVRYAGYTTWRGVCRPDFPVASASIGEYWGRGQRFGFVGIGQGEFYWFAVANAPQHQADGPEGAKPKLQEMFRQWAAPIPTLIDITDEAAIIRTDCADRKPVEKWGEGPVTVLGDAAHPMTPNMGQGAGQAIEDAYALAAHLAALPSDLPTALRNYEAARIPRTTRFVKQSRQMGEMGQWRTGAGALTRNMLIRLTPRFVMRRSIVRMLLADLPPK